MMEQDITLTFSNEEMAEIRAQRAERICVQMKWMRVLCALIPFTLLANLLGNGKEIVRILLPEATVPDLSIVGQALSVLCTAVAAWVFRRLRDVSDSYRICFLCCFVCASLGALSLYFTAVMPEANWGTVLALPVLIGSLLWGYFENLAHADNLCGVDEALPRQWRMLAAVYGISCIALIILPFAILFIPVLFSTALGVILSHLFGVVFIAAAVAFAGTSVMRMVYLLRSAEVMRKYVHKYGAHRSAPMRDERMRIW